MNFGWIVDVQVVDAYDLVDFIGMRKARTYVANLSAHWYSDCTDAADSGRTMGGSTIRVPERSQ